LRSWFGRKPPNTTLVHALVVLVVTAHLMPGGGPSGVALRQPDVLLAGMPGLALTRLIWLDDGACQSAPESYRERQCPERRQLGRL
jgi:hypothetical protein